MLRLNLEVNEDIEHRLHQHTKKNKNVTIGKLINRILENWSDQLDNEEYSKSLPKHDQETESVHPNDFCWDGFELRELKTNIDQWIEKYGADAAMINPGYETNKLKMEK